MKKGLILSALLVLWVATTLDPVLTAQQVPSPTYIPSIKFASGREIVPYLEGWLRNQDGTFDFVFGYLNRNQQQELVIPPGPENMVSPGPADQGQPTYFMTRRQFRIFRVRVPKDFGDKSLTWSITANGLTQKVVAKLVPAYEKDEKFITMNNNTTVIFGENDPNKPPSLQVPATIEATANQPVALTAVVTDDGLPKPRVVNFDDPDRPTEQAPGEPDSLARFKSQKNTSNQNRLVGPRVTWQIYRGTGRVKLDQMVVPVAAGRATTNATFAAPGSYTLIATAGDGRLNVFQRVTVNVQ